MQTGGPTSAASPTSPGPRGAFRLLLSQNTIQPDWTGLVSATEEQQDQTLFPHPNYPKLSPFPQLCLSFSVGRGVTFYGILRLYYRNITVLISAVLTNVPIRLTNNYIIIMTVVMPYRTRVHL